MSRLTLRLPDTLHKLLSQRANREGISLDQYIVYALTREETLSHIVQAVSDTDSQRTAFTTLLEKLGRASFDEIRAVLDDRESVAPENGLSPDTVARLKRKVAENRRPRYDTV